MPESESNPAAGSPLGALAVLRELLGPAGLFETAPELVPYLTDHRRIFHGAAAGIARPRNTAEVVEIVRICAHYGLGIVPQGGNTGYCGGATPDRTGRQLVVALERMNTIRSVDAAGFNMTAEAGCTLAQVQEAAAAADRLFPLSLGSEGSCQIGGNLSTNAGGTAVLRYGVTRELVLGIEAVLADGRVVRQLSPLRKDNTGYDVKQWFIGAEGTLGIITAACLKLWPQPASFFTALVSVQNLDDAVELLSALRARAGDSAVAFEIMPRSALELAIANLPQTRDPMDAAHPWYVLIELSIAPFIGAAAPEALTQMFGDFAQRRLLGEAVIATSAAQRDGLWRLREGIPRAQTLHGRSLKHDISLPIAAIPRFVDDIVAAVLTLEPALVAVVYGHLGDGNLHFNFSVPHHLPEARFSALAHDVQRLVHDELARRGGSFSAEHGIGQLKVSELHRYEDPVALQIMRDLKRALDPHNIMNPGKVLTPR